MEVDFEEIEVYCIKSNLAFAKRLNLSVQIIEGKKFKQDLKYDIKVMEKWMNVYKTALIHGEGSLIDYDTPKGFPSRRKRRFLVVYLGQNNDTNRQVFSVSSSYDPNPLNLNDPNFTELEEVSVLALEGSMDGIWDWDVKTGRLYLSESWGRMLGYESREDDLNTWLNNSKSL